MFSKNKSFHLSSSTSSLYNNLSFANIKDHCIVAAVHHSIVNLYIASSTESNQRQVVVKEPTGGAEASPYIFQAKIVETASRHVLVIATGRGIQMYDADGSAMLFWHPLQSDGGSRGFTRGIAAVGSNTICCGTDKGRIIMFNVPTSGNNITKSGTFDEHKSPITDMCRGGDTTLISSDEDGLLLIWSFEKDSITLKARVAGSVGNSWPINSIGVWLAGGCIAAAYGSGHVRFFDLLTGELLAEVTAHARQVTAIDVAEEAGLVLSVSEDTMARVWKLERANRNNGVLKVSLFHSEVVTDQALQGAQFCSPSGSKFCLASFDSNEIFNYKMNNT